MSAINEAIGRIQGQLLLLDYLSNLDLEAKENERYTKIIRGNLAIIESELTVLREDNIGLRRLLFLRHGCGFDALYGDDGELQCSSCLIDFKRMSAEDISRKFQAIGIAKVAESIVKARKEEL